MTKFSDDSRPAGAAATQGVEGDALALLTQLFNARQRVQYAQSELDNAKETLKMAKRVEEEIMLGIAGAVPRLHAVAKEKNLLHKGLETMPPLLDWKREAEVKNEVRNAPNQGDPGDENDHEPSQTVSEDGRVTFGRYVAKKLSGTDSAVDEYEVTCQDCTRNIARVKVPSDLWTEIPEDQSFGAVIVEHFRKGCCDIHDELYHNGNGPGLP